MRVLTTLLDHAAFPAADIAVLYAERWQIEIAFLHLKKTVRGPRRPLRGQSPELARQEAWYGSRTSGCDLREDMAVAPVRRGAAAS